MVVLLSFVWQYWMVERDGGQCGSYELLLIQYCPFLWHWEGKASSKDVAVVIGKVYMGSHTL